MEKDIRKVKIRKWIENMCIVGILFMAGYLAAASIWNEQIYQIFGYHYYIIDTAAEQLIAITLVLAAYKLYKRERGAWAITEIALIFSILLRFSEYGRSLHPVLVYEGIIFFALLFLQKDFVGTVEKRTVFMIAAIVVLIIGVAIFNMYPVIKQNTEGLGGQVDMVMILYYTVITLYSWERWLFIENPTIGGYILVAFNWLSLIIIEILVIYPEIQEFFRKGKKANEGSIE